MYEVPLRVAIGGNVDAGKCLKKDTPVLMFDGKIKMIQNIKIGDVVMGDDNLPRNVLHTTSGRDIMYNIKMIKGGEYTVNSHHILCLKNKNNIIDINVEDFLKLPNLIQKKWYGYKAEVDFEYKEVMDPYKFGYKLSIEDDIPDIYKYNSNSVKLQLLKGFIDAVGNINEEIVTIIYTKRLYDLEYICNSLGFWTTVDTKNNKLIIIGTIGNRMSRIKVTKLEEDEYFGFSLDGNKRFLLGDFIVTHNSSFIGYLKTGIVDDGNGLSRNSVFNFPHEKLSGRTSSVSQVAISINNKKIICYDLAGHEKYLKTTLSGISSSYPDIMLILIESNKGIQQMTKEHIISSIYLRIPIVIVMTKLDISISNKLNTNIRIIKKVMKSVGRNIYEINEENNIDTAVNTISETIVPLFKISSVKGNDINPPLHYLTQFLHKLNIKVMDIEEKETLFVIDKSFKTEGYPLIASGYMRYGKINVNDKLFIGPVNNEYIEIYIRSIHDDDKNNISFLRKNEMGCVSIKAKNIHKNQIRSGMIITNKLYPFVSKFVGAVTIFSSHSTTIKIGYNTIIHCGALRKTVNVYKIEDEKGNEIECLRGGDNNVRIYFEFMHGKHIVLENDRFIFREGRTRGSGYIINIE